MNTTERVTLMSAFERILDNEDDPVMKLLVMTYEFDDQQLLNMLIQRPLSDRLDPKPAHAAQVADLAPVVIYDARKTRPQSVLPHFLDLLPVRVGAWRCHHPKAYLVVTRKCVHLLIGSMNLTASGLFGNREAFCSFTWHDKALAYLHLLESFVTLLESESEYRKFGSASLDAVLASVRSHMDDWHVDRSNVPLHATLLVANGFGPNGSPVRALDRLKAFFRAHFKEPPDSLYIVSPFFDKGASGHFLIGEIEARFGPLAIKEIATDEAALVGLSRAHLGPDGRRAVFAIPPEVSQAERRKISQANDGAAAEALVLQRKLHAKVWILGCGERRLIYVGSGNFTCKAWCGDNHELGVAWIEEGDASSLWRILRKDLFCGDTDRFETLALMPGPAAHPDDEDDYVEERGYPDFVTGIDLSWHEDVVRFTVRAQVQPVADLARFRVDWDGLALTFELAPGAAAAVSQPLSDQLVRARLIGGRNLRFELIEDETVAHFLPFRHDRALFDRRFEFVHPTADDWMAHCLGRDLDRGSLDPDEHLPEDEPVASPLTRVPDDRANNAVIRTQRYLSDFNDVETEFRKRSNEWAEAADSDPVAWDLRVGQPLATFARILERTVDDPVDRSFRLGELKLLADELLGPPEGQHKLAVEVLAALRRRSANLAAGERAPRGLDPYLRFVEGTLR